jgi:hypothetical protein
MLSVLPSADRVLTRLNQREPPTQPWAVKPNVSWIDELPIFCGYEAQSLDLFSDFVRIGQTNLSEIGRFRFAPVVLFAGRRQPFRERSVANWQ